jgi:hypothetical protein
MFRFHGAIEWVVVSSVIKLIIPLANVADIEDEVIEQ